MSYFRISTKKIQKWKTDDFAPFLDFFSRAPLFSYGAIPWKFCKKIQNLKKITKKSKNCQFLRKRNSKILQKKSNINRKNVKSKQNKTKKSKIIDRNKHKNMKKNIKFWKKIQKLEKKKLEKNGKFIKKNNLKK